ncbi:SDR family oxidoreductase [Saccharopolyspora sp. K220]|uniref:SDR family NAD(P)-dependent oxidoreductase n=1 Tax=Saccharopolyspora soli TaxID=2926618 RepID=UPI001F582CDC|nr:SDR family oxidoreductase [Saccharopolyspora soli]MCI2423691.1 SDR family oxidoreductase [Saccharopolyspora soli]
MDLDLSGRCFLVTGASKGLGFATARALVDEGANVVVSSSSEDNTAAAVAALGDNARGLAADLTDPGTPRRLIDYAREQFGRLDGLFVSHGGPPAGVASELDDDTLRRGLEIAAIAPIRIAREVAAELGEGGSIVVLTSTSGAQPLTGLASSNVARPATQGFVKDLANEIGSRGVRINALLPGTFETERALELAAKNPAAREKSINAAALRRVGDPAELGAVAAFLLSPKASYVTGAAWTVDGGRRAGM